MQKGAGKENRKWWCFPRDHVLHFPDLTFCPGAFPNELLKKGERMVSSLQCPHGSGKHCFSRCARSPQVSLLLPLPFDAQTPASHGQEGCSLPDISTAPVSPGGPAYPLSAPSHRENLRYTAATFSTEPPPWGGGKRAQTIKYSTPPPPLLSFWNPQCASEKVLPTQPLPVGKQV